ncbi:hypothetical protein HFD95_21745 [Pantoea sp. EKM10T]|uniref:hypothetical protein n=1 Tax=Pantoea sp. EKM10T TaxID=2708058 RepID=UPI00142DF965|nr:hypothetical protein [Pantoea sp. EKM10T]KAF6625938.1 hypothetical protein HFD95_21745 [Pantoea sp. EKM10T]
MMTITAHDSHYAQFEDAELNGTGGAYDTLRDLGYELDGSRTDSESAPDSGAQKPTRRRKAYSNNLLAYWQELENSSNLPAAIDDILTGSLNCFDKMKRSLVWQVLTSQPVINAAAVQEVTQDRYSQRWCRQVAEAIEHFLVMLDMMNERHSYKLAM